MLDRGERSAQTMKRRRYQKCVPHTRASENLVQKREGSGAHDVLPENLGAQGEA
jgi:hypothetical protein